MGPGGPVLTLTPDLGPAVAPALGTINIQGVEGETYGFGILVSQATLNNPAPFPANTIRVEPLARGVTTNDGVATIIADITIPMDQSSAYVLSAHVIGARSDYTAACGGFTVGAFRREAAGGAILVGGAYQTLANEDAPIGTPTFGVGLNGNIPAVFVQGLAGQIWNWTCTYTFQKQLQ